MSSLGIRFALPYKGSNGIKVVDNVIVLDNQGSGSIGQLFINNQNVVRGGDAALAVFTNEADNPLGQAILVQDVIIPGNQCVIYNQGATVVKNIKTFEQNSNAPIISFDLIKNGITTDPTTGVVITADGNTAYAAIGATGL